MVWVRVYYIMHSNSKYCFLKLVSVACVCVDQTVMQSVLFIVCCKFKTPKPSNLSTILQAVCPTWKAFCME